MRAGLFGESSGFLQCLLRFSSRALARPHRTKAHGGRYSRTGHGGQGKHLSREHSARAEQKAYCKFAQHPVRPAAKERQQGASQRGIQLSDAGNLPHVPYPVFRKPQKPSGLFHGAGCVGKFVFRRGDDAH